MGSQDRKVGSQDRKVGSQDLKVGSQDRKVGCHYHKKMQCGPLNGRLDHSVVLTFCLIIFFLENHEFVF